MICRNMDHSQPTLRVSNLQLNLDSRQVLVDGRPVHFTRKEFLVLELLVLRKSIVSKETFMDHLYGDGRYRPNIAIIDTFISHLRRKLAQAGAGDLIRTARGHGYTLPCGRQI